MKNFLEIVKSYFVAIVTVLFAGLILYGTIVIGLVILTAGLVIGLIAWMVFYWKFKSITRQQHQEPSKDLYYYQATNEAVHYEEEKR